MTIGTSPSQPDSRAETLVTAYERGGYRRVMPAILQPAEPFLDLSGEDIRKRMYLTTDPEGRELGRHALELYTQVKSVWMRI